MPPNILLVMTDQHRAGLSAAEGFPLDTMPFCDSFAASGMRIRRAYTTAPACVPARTSLLTGRWPSTHRVRQNSATHEVVRGDDLLDVLREAGYQLLFAGKTHMYRGASDFDSFAGPYWHERGPDETSEQHGFARWLKGIDQGPTTEPTPYPLELQFPHRIVSDAVAAMDERDPSKPFFSFVSFPEPHNPYQVPEPYYSMFADEIPDRVAGPEAAYAKGGSFTWLRKLVEEKRPGYDDLWRRYRANYCGMLRLIDDQVRRLIAHVRDAGLLDDTLVVFVADHGDYFADYGLQRKGAGEPDVLMRIPFWAVGPGVVGRDNTTDFVSLADVFPTLCEVVGLPVPLGVQGRSLWPMLSGADYPAEEFASVYAERGFGGRPYDDDARPVLHFSYEGTGFDCLNSVTQSGFTRMLRQGDWKLTYDNVGRGELYDIVTDPLELDNRWNDPRLRDVRFELTEQLLWWSTRITDDLPDAKYKPRQVDRNWYSRIRVRPVDDELEPESGESLRKEQAHDPAAH